MYIKCNIWYIQHPFQCFCGFFFLHQRELQKDAFELFKLNGLRKEGITYYDRLFGNLNEDKETTA